VEKERNVMLQKLNELQTQQATRTKPHYNFRPINDFVQLFQDEVGYNLNNISHNLGRLEAMQILVLLFGSTKWMIEFMWIEDEGEEDESEEDEGEEEEDEEENFEFPYIDDNELGPEGGGYAPED
jgi:hypothetical protein